MAGLARAAGAMVRCAPVPGCGAAGGVGARGAGKEEGGAGEYDAGPTKMSGCAHDGGAPSDGVRDGSAVAPRTADVATGHLRVSCDRGTRVRRLDESVT